MDKFDLYARRNVFRKPSEGSSSIESIMPRLEDSSAHAADLRELNALRLSYSGLLRTNSNLSAECRDADILVHDMRESLFKLRVGAQVLEETNLPEALASTAQSRDVLRALTERSIGKNSVFISEIYQERKAANFDNFSCRPLHRLYCKIKYYFGRETSPGGSTTSMYI